MLVSRFSRPPACLSSLWPSQRAVDWQQHFGCPTAAAWLLALRCCSTAVVCDAALQGIHQVDNAAPSQQSALPLLFCAKLKHLVRKAVARSAETICVTTGENPPSILCPPIAPTISETQALPKSIML
jgi:hypothetical protein